MAEGLAAWQCFLKEKTDGALELEQRIARMFPLGEPDAEVNRTIARISSRWCHYGFPLIDLASHRYAAALAVTDVCDDLRLPWPCFVVRIPNGIISTTHSTRGRVDLTTIAVNNQPDHPGGNLVHVCAWPPDGMYAGCGSHMGLEIAAAAARGDLEAEGPGDHEPYPHSKRRHQLVLRIAFNAATALLAENSPERLYQAQRRNDGDARPPRTRRFAIGSPVETDFRGALTDWVEGRAKNLKKLQWMVRGHWRNQPHGLGGRDRRPQWIAPHWARRKGAGEDAPIPLRPHRLSRPSSRHRAANGGTGRHATDENPE